MTANHPSKDELERRLWMAGVDATPAQVTLIRLVIARHAHASADIISAFIALLKRGTLEVNDDGGDDTGDP